MTPDEPPDDMKVLLVDPDRYTATMYRIGLEQSGFEVESVRTASDLFATAGQGECVIVMEWEHLGLAGPQVLGRLRASDASRDVPVLVLTNRDGDLKKLTQLAAKAGAQGWLVKAHTTPLDLADSVRDLLGKAA